jgi:hypothetical protein
MINTSMSMKKKLVKEQASLLKAGAIRWWFGQQESNIDCVSVSVFSIGSTLFSLKWKC